MRTVGALKSLKTQTKASGPGFAQTSAMAGAARCLALLGLAFMSLGGCAVDNPEAATLSLDRDAFRCNVEPVLMARCGFYACHGSEARPFRIYAPNRLRLTPSVPQLGTPLSPEEREANFESASFFAEGNSTAESLLAGKPLDSDNGGQFHRGKSLVAGRDVFTTTEDLGFARIEAWRNGQNADSDCAPLSEVGP